MSTLRIEGVDFTVTKIDLRGGEVRISATTGVGDYSIGGHGGCTAARLLGDDGQEVAHIIWERIPKYQSLLMGSISIELPIKLETFIRAKW